MTWPSDRAEAQFYVVEEFPGMEHVAVVVYSPDGVMTEVADTVLFRDHPEVPCSSKARTAALQEIGWNPVEWQVIDRVAGTAAARVARAKG